jgi:phosphotransferase system HPr-like phosphotransfer protein
LNFLFFFFTIPYHFWALVITKAIPNKEIKEKMGLKVSSKRFVLSDQTKNLLGFVVLTAGIDISAFKDNPVMLYNHDYEKLIGQWVDWRFEGTKLTAAPGFDENDTFAMEQYQKVEDDILKGASVGLSPVKFNDSKAELSACLLLEASLTPVPNNRKALAIYNSTGKKLSANEVKQYLLSVERTDSPINTDEKMNEKLLQALIALSVLAGHTITLSADAKDEEIEGVIKKVGEKITNLETAKTSLTAEVDKLKKAETDAAEKELDTLLAEAVTEKALSAADVPAWKEFGKVNLTAMKTSLKNLKPVSLVILPTDKTKDEVKGREAWGWDEYALSAPNDLAAMELAEPEKYKLLLSAKQKTARESYSIEA